MEDDLMCSICIDFFVDPVMLDCSHNLCRDCASLIIQKQADRMNITCPLWNAVQYLNSEDDLKLNIVVRNLANSFREKEEQTEVLKCQKCQAPGIYEWLNLKIPLWLNCRNSHLIENPEHQIFELCTKHNLAKKFYCNTCMTVICQRCWKTGHNVHDVSPIEGKQNMLVREAQEKETTIKLVEQIIDQHEMHAQEQMDSLEARKEEYLEKLQDQFSEIVSALQQHVENLTENAERDVDQLQTLYQNDLSAYSEFRAKLSLPPIYSQDIQSLIEHNDFLNSVVSRSDHLRIPPRQIPNLQATFNQAAIGNLLQAGVSRAPQSYVKNKYEQVGVEYTHVNFESAIIPVEQQTREVFSVLPLFSGAECLYRMSGAGTGNDIFHRCVDGQGPFFILVSTANGNIFGAYCEIPLESQGKWKTTDKAWLYTIRQGEQWTCVKLTINPKRANYAVCHDKNFAVMFGSGKDLHLNLNNLSDCRSTVASTYCIPKGMKTSPDRVLAGSYYKWDITEIEVFRVQLCDSLPSRPLLEKRVTEGKRDAVPAILVAKNILKMWRDFEPSIGIYVPDLLHVAQLPSNSIQSIIDGYDLIVVLVETEDITGGCNHTLGIVKRTEVTSPCIFLADYDDLIVHWDMGDFEFAADDDSLVCRKVGGEASLIWPERFEIEIVGNELQLGGLDLKFDRFRASIMTN